mmetsp:Transcript_11290/g.24993  ORF Transcript_11290/g.24993 Transcript_11290/m.24993 type:complete len:450 (+) Transcript_11290:631-1980(+)
MRPQHQETTPAIKQRNTASNHRHAGVAGPGNPVSGPGVLPIPGWHPDCAGLAGVPGRGNQEVVCENVLVIPLTAELTGPIEVTSRNHWKPCLRRSDSGTQNRGQHPITCVQVFLHGCFRLRIVAPRAMVLSVISQNGAEGAVSSPADQVICPTTEIPSTIGVDVGLQAVEPGGDHGLNTGQQRNLVTCPPHWKPVLSGTVAVIVGRHARTPIRWRKLRECHRSLVESIPAGISHILVVVRHRPKINVGAPPSVRQALPVAPRVGLVDERRGNGESPIAVEPPGCKSALHPLGESLISESHLLRRRLQTTRIAPSHWERMIVEISSETTVCEELKPFRKVGEQVGVGVVIEPVHVIGSAPPVHVQCPNIKRETSGLPPLHLFCGVREAVRVPPCKPGTIGVVRQLWGISYEVQQLLSRSVVVIHTISQQKYVCVSIHIVAKIVSIGFPQL